MRLTFGDILSLFLGLAIAFTSYSAVSQTSDLALNGIATHSELSRQQFMAALYSNTNTTSSNSDSLSRAPAMRMELKILAADGLTLRRFSRMWIEAVSLNNDAELLTAQADNMVLFDSLFKDRLQQNDTLVINYRRSKGVDISLNQVLLGTIDDDDFFTLLVRTWIGSVPPSSDFKNAILQAGTVAADVKSRFDNIQPSPARSREIEKWLVRKPAAVLASSKKTSAKPSAKILAASLPQTVAVKPQALNPPGKSEAVLSASSEANETSTSAATTSPSLTAQTLVARQRYISQLLKKIRANTRYPQRANDLGQSDSVRIALLIDRQGNIINTGLLQGSQYTQLNEAALVAITKSAPLPQMPELLTESTFEFTVPITFVSSKKTTEQSSAQQSLSARASP